MNRKDEPTAGGAGPAPVSPVPGGPEQGSALRDATGQAGWQALWREAADGARREGDTPLDPQEVARLWSGLRAVAADEPAVSQDLVPGVTRALVEAAHELPGGLGLEPPAAAAAVAGPGCPPDRPGILPAGTVRPGLAQLARLLWAEARWLPLPFLVMQLLLTAGGLLLHLVTVESAGIATAAGGLAGAAGSRGAGPELTGWQLVLVSADHLALVAPWLGTLVALAAAWPRRRQLWADLEALSPFPPASRLLARTWVAGILATVLMLVAGWIQPAAVLAAFGDGLVAVPPGPDTAVAVPAGDGAGGAAGGMAGVASSVTAPAFAHDAWTAAAVVLARLAPLWMAAAWALWWQVRTGTLGAMLASAALWTAVTLGGRFLGPWNPLAAGPLPAAGLHVAMLAVALLLAWRLRGQAEVPNPAP